MKKTNTSQQVYSLYVGATNITSKTLEKDIYVFGIQTDPLDGGKISTNETISATFNLEMDPSSINEETFTISDGSTNIDGTVSYDAGNRTATFQPSSVLQTDQSYMATLSTQIKSLVGMSLPYDMRWRFEVAPIQPLFTFAHITDTHVGWEKYIESDYAQSTLSYMLIHSSLTDVLEDIAALNPKPEFILASGDNVEYADEACFSMFISIISCFTEDNVIPIYVV